MVGESRNVEFGNGIHSANRELDSVFEVLSHRCRWYVLASLSEQSQPVALSELAEAVALQEHGAPKPEIPDRELQAISISLDHVHLPKLADSGAVEYDRDRHLVATSGTDTPVNRGFSLLVASEAIGL